MIYVPVCVCASVHCTFTYIFLGGQKKQYMPGRTPKYLADVLIHTWLTNTKSPPGVQDVMPPAETVVDQSGVEVE